MKIKRVEVLGLMGNENPVAFDLNSDLNIVTGLNGSGKTTLLKLMWYVISGNVQHALEEIAFRRVSVETDQYTVIVYKVSSNTCRVEFVIDGIGEDIEDLFEEDFDGDRIVREDARDIINEKISPFGSSLFFPTFRRIEGGFSIQSKSRPGRLFNSARPVKNELQDAIVSVSRRLSSANHTFVTSISTIDVVELLFKKYTELSEESNALQRDTSQAVIERIKAFKREGVLDDSSASSEAASEVLDNIRATIENMDATRKSIMAPLQAVQELGAKLFKHSGISIGSRFNFGDAATAVNSDSLSAGEKQMLSFICYNALTKNSVVFIDEPELSLHVDWQRQLFPTLLSQGTSNQFIIATHSPFIYGKYPEKELVLEENRGDSEVVGGTSL